MAFLREVCKIFIFCVRAFTEVGPESGSMLCSQCGCQLIRHSEFSHPQKTLNFSVLTALRLVEFTYMNISSMSAIH